MTAVASLVGVGIYNAYLKHVPLQKMFFWTTILGTCMGLTQVISIFRLQTWLASLYQVVYNVQRLTCGTCVPVIARDGGKSNHRHQ